MLNIEVTCQNEVVIGEKSGTTDKHIVWCLQTAITQFNEGQKFSQIKNDFKANVSFVYSSYFQHHERILYNLLEKINDVYVGNVAHFQHKISIPYNDTYNISVTKINFEFAAEEEPSQLKGVFTCLKK